MNERMEQDRRPRELDLGKDAVADLTPKSGPAAAEAGADATIGDTPRKRAASAPLPNEKTGPAWPVVGGAVAGALFGLLGSVVYQNVQRPPVTVADPRVAEVEAAIAAVRRDTLNAAQIEQRLSDRIKQIDGRVTGIGETAQVVSDQVAALDKRSATFDQRTAGAEQRAATAEQRAVAAEGKAATLIAPVDDRLKAAEARLGEARDQSVALAKRVDLLAQIEPPKVDLRPIVTKVEELERAAASTAARVTLNGETTLALDGRIKAVEQAATGASTLARATDTSLKAIETSVNDLKSRRPIETASAILAISGLARRGLDQGEAIAPLATALSALGVPDAVLAPLAAYAQSPARGVAALADDYEALATKIAPKAAAPAEAAPRSDGIVDRVTSSLWSQVEVRPVGKPVANDALKIAPQVRQRLLAGDLGGATQLVASLPAEQQAALKGFSDAVAARAAALAALRMIEADAFAAAARKG